MTINLYEVRVADLYVPAPRYKAYGDGAFLRGVPCGKESQSVQADVCLSRAMLTAALLLHMNSVSCEHAIYLPRGESLICATQSVRVCLLFHMVPEQVQ